MSDITTTQLTEALNRLVLEAIHYRDTGGRGEQFLTLAINDALAVLQVQEANNQGEAP